MINKELELIGQLIEVAMTVAELKAENKKLKDINKKLKDINKKLNQTLRIHNVVEQSEQLVCEYCNEDAKPTCCDSCLERMVNAVQKAN